MWAYASFKSNKPAQFEDVMSRDRDLGRLVV